MIIDGALTGINFTSTPTSFRGQDLMPLLPGIRTQLAAKLGDGSNPSVRGVEVVKQGDQIEDPNHTTAYAIHVNAGLQRELRPNLILSAEYVMRRYVHLGALQGGQFLPVSLSRRPARRHSAGARPRGRGDSLAPARGGAQAPGLQGRAGDGGKGVRTALALGSAP